MNTIIKRLIWLGLGTLWSLLTVGAALADDTELYIGNNLSSQAEPNILFIFDNSGSMSTLVKTQDAFDGSITYPSAGCDPTRVYFIVGAGNAPKCSSNRWFNLSALKCLKALNAFKTAGYYNDNMAQYNPGNSAKRWETIANNQPTRVVECRCRPRHRRRRRQHDELVRRQRQHQRNGLLGHGGARRSRGARRPPTKPTRCIAATI